MFSHSLIKLNEFQRYFLGKILNLSKHGYIYHFLSRHIKKENTLVYYQNIVNMSCTCLDICL